LAMAGNSMPIGAVRRRVPTLLLVPTCDRCGRGIYGEPRRHRRHQWCALCWKREDDRAALALCCIVPAFAVAVCLGYRSYAGAWWVVAAWLLLLWAPLLVHESGHAVAAKAMGGRLVEVSIGRGRVLLKRGAWTVRCYPSGGTTRWAKDGAAMSLRRRAIIAAAGPLANAILAGAVLTVEQWRTQPLFLLSAVAHATHCISALWPQNLHNGSRTKSSDGAKLLGYWHAGRAARSPAR
jgi:hypothetical protein